MSVRRLPPGDNPFRPLRCRDVTLILLAFCAAVWSVLGLAFWLVLQ